MYVTVYPDAIAVSSQLCHLYENDCIFDKFECAVSGDATNVVTGSYGNACNLYEVRKMNTSSADATKNGNAMALGHVCHSVSIVLLVALFRWNRLKLAASKYTVYTHGVSLFRFREVYISSYGALTDLRGHEGVRRG